MAEVDLKTLLKRVVELVMPNLRHYYKMPRKGRVVKAYDSDGQYWADVQILRNDESDDTREPVIKRVAIPVIWAGPNRGLVCPPAEGSICDVTYYDGDPDYPCISNFRWDKNKAPNCSKDQLIIQYGPNCFFQISETGFYFKGAVVVDGDLHTTGNISNDGNINSAGTIIDAGGNTNHHAHP